WPRKSINGRKAPPRFPRSFEGLAPYSTFAPAMSPRPNCCRSTTKARRAEAVGGWPRRRSWRSAAWRGGSSNKRHQLIDVDVRTRDDNRDAAPSSFERAPENRGDRGGAGAFGNDPLFPQESNDRLLQLRLADHRHSIDKALDVFECDRLRVEIPCQPVGQRRVDFDCD